MQLCLCLCNTPQCQGVFCGYRDPFQSLFLSCKYFIDWGIFTALALHPFLVLVSFPCGVEERKREAITFSQPPSPLLQGSSHLPALWLGPHLRHPRSCPKVSLLLSNPCFFIINLQTHAYDLGGLWVWASTLRRSLEGQPNLWVDFQLLSEPAAWKPKLSIKELPPSPQGKPPARSLSILLELFGKSYGPYSSLRWIDLFFSSGISWVLFQMTWV